MGTKQSRRQFIHGGGGATLGLAGLPALAQAKPKRKPDNPYGGFTVGVQSYSFRNFTREQALVRIQKLGLNFVEFYNVHVPLNSTEAQIKAIRNLCQEHRITPIAFGVDAFSTDHAANRRKV